MFSWLKKKAPPSTLYFKSNDAAFEYATIYMQGPLKAGAVLVGQVLGKPHSDFATTGKSRVRLATDCGVIETDHCGSIAVELASHLSLKASTIQPGDLVAVEVGSYNPKYPPDSYMQYFLVLAKLRPEIEASKHAFVPDLAS